MIAAAKQQALRLWNIEITDPTPGWGVSASYLILSARKPTRATVLEVFDGWQDDLRVHPGDLAVDAFERKLQVSITLATYEDASELNVGSGDSGDGDNHKSAFAVLKGAA